MNSFKSVLEYLEHHEDKRAELMLLREIVLSTELEETVKWGAPTYTLKGKNVLGLGAFKSYVGIWFFQGALLKDPEKVLINAQEEKTKAMRQWRFQTIEEIDAEKVLLYVEEAIQNQKEGKVIKPEKRPLIIPDELQKAFSADKQLADAFEQLTLTRKREYAEHLLAAKREATRMQRLDKMIPLILDGKGLYDKYKR